MIGGAILAVAAIAAPVIWAAVTGLIGIVVAGVIVSTSLTVAPLFAALLSNLRIQGFKIIAARNPIEHLQNDYMRQEKLIEQLNQEILKAAAEANLYDENMKELVREYPAEAAQFHQDSKLAHEQIGQMREEHGNALQDLVEYEAEIKKAAAVYKMALARERLVKVVGHISGDYMDKIRKETAIDSVKLKVSHSRAALEQSVLQARNRRLGKQKVQAAKQQAAQQPLPMVERVESPVQALSNNPSPAVPVLSNQAGNSGRFRPVFSDKK